jgi:3-methyl-2-oxobutanoate hydroxymethyltransferase
MTSKVTTKDLLIAHQNGRKISSLTAYDSLMATMIDEAGIDLVLIGDSLGMTMLGYDSTIPVSLEESLHHTAAVARVVKRAMVIGDMPFMTFHLTIEDTLRNAARYLQEAGADGVKIEGGTKMALTVERIVDCGIPVLGHIGLLPQKVGTEGGYRIHGKEPQEAAELIQDAKDLESAGAFGIVLEGIPGELAREITLNSAIPTIGIGAGPFCSGQIQVSHDILGLFETFVPKHTKQYANLAEEMRQVFKDYLKDVKDEHFPGPDNYI